MHKLVAAIQAAQNEEGPRQKDSFMTFWDMEPIGIPRWRSGCQMKLFRLRDAHAEFVFPDDVGRFHHFNSELLGILGVWLADPDDAIFRTPAVSLHPYRLPDFGDSRDGDQTGA